MSALRPLACWLILGLTPLHAADRLTSRPRPAAPADKALEIGSRVTTAGGEQRRVVLPDRSTVFVRENSAVTVRAESALELGTGEVFVETAPGKLAPTVVVKTPNREVRAKDTRFGVRADGKGSRVVVAAGEARVAGVEQPVRGGQVLEPDATKPTRAPRLAHLIHWTRDLRSAAPLVPTSDHAGGTLVARDPDGQEVNLELRSYTIDVHLEDGFSRTTIDQTFFNNSDERLEGTFRFPLPPDASLSRLAMYVDGKLMEGGMAERDHARAAYERIVYEKRDPALLEWVDGSTFKMRVFPLEARQEKRLLLSYTQKLPSLYGNVSYRFPAGHSLSRVKQWAFRARVKGGAAMGWACESHQLREMKDGDDLRLGATLKDARLDRDVVLSVADGGKEGVKFARSEHDGGKYLLVRYRPELVGEAVVTPKDWVVLVETSGDRDPLLMRAQIELVRALLSNASREDTFAIVTANTRAKATKAVRNDLVAIDEAMAELEKAHLVGALDLGAALTEARTLLDGARNGHLVHVGSGIAAMGEAKTSNLLSRLPKGTKYVGVGVGRRWNRPFMQTAAETTGGYFAQVNPDEPIAWRGLEIASTLDAPRLLDVRITDPAGRATFLPFGRMACQGEEVSAVARVAAGEELPRRVRIVGTLDGKEVVNEFDVADGRDRAAYLPRSWAKLEIERLLAEDAAKHRPAVVELSKAMYVMTPFTSLLVLENDDMYAQFKVDRGRKDHWAMYPAPAAIKVVHEPIDGDVGDPKRGVKPAARVVTQTVVTRLSPLVLSQAQFDGRERADESRKFVTGSDVTRQSVILREAALSLSVNDRRDEFARKALNDADEAPANARFAPMMFGDGDGVSFERTLKEDSPVNHDGKNLAPAPDTLGLVIRTSGGGKDTSLQDDMAGTASAGRDGRQVFNFFMGSGREGQAADKSRLPSPPRPTPASVASPLYARPNYAGDPRVSSDLVSCAPGFNTTDADVLAVVEAEAKPLASTRPGTIDPGARKLLDAARKAGWRVSRVPGQGAAAGYAIHHDAADCWAWSRTLASGLHEQVVCDGKTLWHVYPELGLAARREVGRAHRMELASRVAGAVPNAEDLARGADVRLIDERTVAVVPQGAPKSHVQLNLVFTDGRVAERRWVEMPTKKILHREICPEPEEADEPALTADVKDLVVVSMPFRTPEQVHARQKTGGKSLTDLTFAEATQLLAAFVAQGNADQAKQVFRDALHRREQRQLGYYVLLAAAGVPLDHEVFAVAEEHPGSPLANYLAVHSSPVLRKHASRWAAASNAWEDGFLRTLGLGHALLQRWSGKMVGTAEGRAAEREKALAYVNEHAGSALAWALLGQVQDRANEEKDHDAWADLAKAYAHFLDSPGFADLARYENARCLWKAGRSGEARKRFLALYADGSKHGQLPRIDGDFRAALLGADRDGWADLMRRTTNHLIDTNRRPAALLLAWQCWQLDDRATAQTLFRTTLQDASPKGKEGLHLYAAAIDFLKRTSQHDAAAPLLDALLADSDHAKRPELWRQAASIAEAREQHAKALAARRTALDLEYDQQPERINLEQVRRDYSGLLDEYETLAKSLKKLSLPEPAGFRQQVVRAADRWRALDSHNPAACNQCARILRTLGDRELAWDYLTTPVALRPGESDVWVSLAQTLALQNERDLADRAYQSAFERELTNAQVLWDRADNLRLAGRQEQARKLWRQLADGDWQPRFASLKEQARWLVEGK